MLLRLEPIALNLQTTFRIAHGTSAVCVRVDHGQWIHADGPGLGTPPQTASVAGGGE